MAELTDSPLVAEHGVPVRVASGCVLMAYDDVAPKVPKSYFGGQVFALAAEEVDQLVNWGVVERVKA